jgi:hypothetical protein
MAAMQADKEEGLDPEKGLAKAARDDMEDF